jgi:hypothetical protein
VGRRLRIAICISGQLRLFENAIGRFKKTIIDPLDPDIFIDVWANRGAHLKLRDSRSYFRSNQRVSHLGLRAHFPSARHIRIEEFDNEMYSNILGIEVPKLFHRRLMQHSLGSFPMYYKIWTCDMLRQEYEKIKGFKYDLVFRARPDTYLETPIDNETLSLDGSIIALGKSMNKRENFVWDTFFGAPSDVMSELTDIFPFLATKLSYGDERQFTEGEYESYLEEYKGSLLLTNYVSHLGIKIQYLSNRLFIEDAIRGYSSSLYKLINLFSRIMGKLRAQLQ